MGNWQPKEAVINWQIDNPGVPRELADLLAYFSTCADSTGFVKASPARETIAKRFTTSKKTIRNRLARLYELGVLEQVRVGRPGLASQFRILLPMPTQEEPVFDDQRYALDDRVEQLEQRMASVEKEIRQARQELGEAVGQLTGVLERLTSVLPESEAVFLAETGGNGRNLGRKRAEPRAETGGTSGGNGRNLYSGKSGSDPSLDPSLDPTLDPITTSITGEPACDDKVDDDGKAVLVWMGFEGTLSEADGQLTLANLLAWAYWVKLKQGKKGVGNPVALARHQWRQGTTPPDGLLAIAETWLGLGTVERLLLLQSLDDAMLHGQPFELPDSIDTWIPTEALTAVYKSAKALAPPRLSPPVSELDIAVNAQESWGWFVKDACRTRPELGLALKRAVFVAPDTVFTSEDIGAELAEAMVERYGRSVWQIEQVELA